MAEVLVKFTEPIKGKDGRLYEVQVCGDVSPDGLWHGWIEFASGKHAMRTGKETGQPNRVDLMYWAQGLSVVYLEGALERAEWLQESPVIEANHPPAPWFEQPAQNSTRRVSPAATVASAVLDPFAVYAQGEDILSRQLLALSPDHLRNLISVYDLRHNASGRPSDNMEKADLVKWIVAVVRVRASIG